MTILLSWFNADLGILITEYWNIAYSFWPVDNIDLLYSPARFQNNIKHAECL